MLGDIFYWVINMSLGATVIGTAVWLVGKLPWMPRRVVCWLWAAPLARLWIPFGMDSRFSLMGLIVRLGAHRVPVWEKSTSWSMLNMVQGVTEYSPMVYRYAGLERIFQIAGVIWLLGMMVLLSLVTCAYRRAMGEAKRATALRETVFSSTAVTTPAVYGIFRPRILIPTDCGTLPLEYALRHERAHIRRGDNLWRLLGVVSACVHWFNPVVWLGLKRFLQDLELGCDETVLVDCTPAERKAYAKELLQWGEKTSDLVSAFGGPGLKTRIGKILSYKKLSVLAWMFFLALAASIGYILLTNGG